MDCIKPYNVPDGIIKKITRLTVVEFIIGVNITTNNKSSYGFLPPELLTSILYFN
jgi:hypothetical protein